MRISVAVLSRYELIRAGVVSILQRHEEDIRVLSPDTDDPADVLVWASFGTTRVEDFTALRAEHRATHVAVLCWDFEPEMVKRAIASGADGYLSTTLTAEELVSSLQRIHAGETVVSPAPDADDDVEALPSWPGKEEGLSERESDIVALITSGLSNDEIAGRLFLSINTVKSYIRSAYAKMQVSNRSQAVLWGVDHGLRPAR